MQVIQAVGGSTSTSALWFDGDAYTTSKAEVFLGDGTGSVGEEVWGVATAGETIVDELPSEMVL